MKYFPEEYSNLDASLKIEYKDENGKTRIEEGIYALFRCGMVHEFFIKGFATIYNNPLGYIKEHIGIVKAERLIEWPKDYGIAPYPNKVLEFHTNEYFRDFRAAIDKIFKLLIIDKDQRLLKGFNESLDRVYSRKIL